MPQFILCDCCGKSVEDFESRLEYFKHLQIAEKCKNCDKDFLSKHDLNAHTIETLRALHDVKEACFKPILKPNWRETITRFKNGWCDLFMDFEIGFSNKVHIIIEHIPQVIERTGRSLPCKPGPSLVRWDPPLYAVQLFTNYSNYLQSDPTLCARSK